MSHEAAMMIAEALGGDAVRGEEFSDGSSDWLVRIARADGRLVVLSEKSVDEYYDPDSAARGRCYLSISLV